MSEDIPKLPKILYTKDGKPMPPPIPAPPDANDVHVVFDPLTGKFIKVHWTKDGDIFGPPVPIPDGANDFAFGFSEFRELPPPREAPPGANDFEFFWREGRITEAWWTRDGQRIEPMPLDPEEDAVHIDISAKD